MISTAFAADAHTIWRFLPWKRQFPLAPSSKSPPLGEGWREKLRTRKYLSDCFHYFPAAQIRGVRSMNFSNGERERKQGWILQNALRGPAELVKGREKTGLNPPERPAELGSRLPGRNKVVAIETVAVATRETGQMLPGEAVAECHRLGLPVTTIIHYSSKWRVSEWDFFT